MQKKTSLLSKDCLGFALTGIFKLELMVCSGCRQRLMQGLYGMYGALSTEPTFGEKACLGPTLPCLIYTLKLLTDYNHWTL